jgi:hypothetical protein
VTSQACRPLRRLTLLAAGYFGIAVLMVDLVTGSYSTFIGRDSNETVFTPDANVRRRKFFSFHFEDLPPATAGLSW